MQQALKGGAAVVAVVALAWMAGSGARAESAQGAAPATATSDPFTASTFSEFRLRAVGPALMSGRISAIAVHPEDRNTWYLGVASGGVWKTTNAGITFAPVFQNEASYSIGSVVIDAANPNTLWVGTGEANNQRSVGYGDGLYRSDDAGRTWRNVGLKTSEHIGRIVIDPRDSEVVFAAAYGPLWSAGGDRGLYRTDDGGATWDKVLEVSEHTGVSDVAIDPLRPDVMLAVAHQRRRHTWTLIHGGSESGLHKSTDGGTTWRKVRTGLPTGRCRPDRHRLFAGPVGLGLCQGRNRREYCHLRVRGFWRELGAPGHRAGAADVLQEHPSGPEEPGSPLRAHRANADLG